MDLLDAAQQKNSQQQDPVTDTPTDIPDLSSLMDASSPTSAVPQGQADPIAEPSQQPTESPMPPTPMEPNDEPIQPVEQPIPEVMPEPTPEVIPEQPVSVPDTDAVPQPPAPQQTISDTIPQADIPTPPKRKPKFNGLILAAIAFFLLTLPVIGFFVNQRNRQIADTRSEAATCTTGVIGLGACCGDNLITEIYRNADCTTVNRCTKQWSACAGNTNTPPPNPGSQCSPDGVTKCEGLLEYRCQGGQWIHISSDCGVAPTSAPNCVQEGQITTSTGICCQGLVRTGYNSDFYTCIRPESTPTPAPKLANQACNRATDICVTGYTCQPNDSLPPAYFCKPANSPTPQSCTSQGGSCVSGGSCASGYQMITGASGCDSAQPTCCKPVSCTAQGGSCVSGGSCASGYQMITGASGCDSAQPTCCKPLSSTPQPTPTTSSGGGSNPTPTSGSNVNPTPAVCQGGTGTPDSTKVLLCECQNGCTYKYDNPSGGGGGWGWVCDSNCRLVDKATWQSQRDTSKSCFQLDYVKNGTSDYCGVMDVSSCLQPQCQTSPTSPPGSNPTPTNVPAVAQCQNIKLYRNGTLLTTDQYNTIKPGQVLTLTVVGTNAEKARFTINSAAPVETTTKNAQGEYTYSYTVPTLTVQTTFTIQAEIYGNGAWR